MSNNEELNVLFLTSEEVIRILRISRRTLQNYRTDSKIPFYRLTGRTVRYRMEDVIKFLQNSSSCSYQKDAYKKYIQKF